VTPIFLPQLVQENDNTAGFADVAGDFAQGLAHQAGLQSHVGIAHVPFNFGFGYQGRYRVHNNNIYGGRAHQGVHDFQGGFPVIWLGDQQVLHVNAQGGSVIRVKGMFGIHKGGNAPPFLHFGDGMEGNGGFPRAFGAVDFHNSSLG
jgi:hypothetical protein